MLLSSLVACNGVRDRAQLAELSAKHIESPSGAWVAGKSVEGNKWVVEIHGRGDDRFRDEPGPLGAFQVYWAWDAQDRLWLYDSDDGTVRFWSRAGDTWTRQTWEVGYGDTDQANYLCGHAETSPTPAIPASMFPLKLTPTALGKLSERIGKECAPPLWSYP